MRGAAVGQGPGGRGAASPSGMAPATSRACLLSLLPVRLHLELSYLRRRGNHRATNYEDRGYPRVVVELADAIEIWVLAPRPPG